MRKRLVFIFNRMFHDAKKEAVEQFMGVFLDLQQKSMNSEISTKPLDLRGLLAAMKIVRTGLSPWQAVRMGIVNKTFDVFEKGNRGGCGANQNSTGLDTGRCLWRIKENESLKISAKLVDLEDAEEFLKKSAIGKEKIKIAAGDKKSEKFQWKYL